MMQFVTQIAYLDERLNVEKETAILISLLNFKHMELTPFLLYRRRHHKREIHHVLLETVRKYAEKVFSYENLEF